MPLFLLLPLLGLGVGGGVGYFLGVETSKLMKLAAVLGVLYLLWKKGAFK